MFVLVPLSFFTTFAQARNEGITTNRKSDCTSGSDGEKNFARMAAEASMQQNNILPGVETKDEFVVQESESDASTDENEESSDTEESSTSEEDKEEEEEEEDDVAEGDNGNGDEQSFHFFLRGVDRQMEQWDNEEASNVVVSITSDSGTVLARRHIDKFHARHVMSQGVLRQIEGHTLVWAVEDIVHEEVKPGELEALQDKYAEVITQLLRASYSTSEQVRLEDAPIMLYAMHQAGTKEDQQKRLLMFVHNACRNARGAVVLLRQCLLSKHCTKTLKLDHEIAKLLFTEENMDTQPAVVELLGSLPFEYLEDVSFVHRQPCLDAMRRMYMNTLRCCQPAPSHKRLAAASFSHRSWSAQTLSVEQVYGARVGAVCVGKRVFFLRDGQVSNRNVLLGRASGVSLRPPNPVRDIVPNGKLVALFGSNQWHQYDPKTGRYVKMPELPGGCTFAEHTAGCMVGSRMCCVVSCEEGAARCLASCNLDEPGGLFQIHQDIRFVGNKVHLLGGFEQHGYALHSGGVVCLVRRGEDGFAAHDVVFEELSCKPDLTDTLSEAVLVERRENDCIYLADKSGAWWEVTVSRKINEEGKIAASARLMDKWARVSGNSTSHTLAFVVGTQMLYVSASRHWNAVDLFVSPVYNALMLEPHPQPQPAAAAAAAEVPRSSAKASNPKGGLFSALFHM